MSSQMNSSTPAGPPPPGVTSNFVDPPSWYAWTLGVGIPCMVIMTACVGMRTYTKVFILKQFRYEDAFALIALAGFLTWDIIYIYLTSIGVTRDVWNIRAEDMPWMNYLFNVIQIIYSPAMLFAKLFIIVQLKRIFCPRGTRTAVWWALMTLAFISVSYYIACFFVFLFECHPRKAIWDPDVKGKCIDKDAAVLSAGFINLIIDCLILVVSVWAIWHLHMSLKRKLGVASIFTAGFITIGFAICGVVYRFLLLADSDWTRGSAKVGLWTFAEYTGTILIGCMPSIPQFFNTTILPSLSNLSGISDYVLKTVGSFGKRSGSGLDSTEGGRSEGSASMDLNEEKPVTPASMVE